MYTYLMVRKSSVARDISSGPSSTSIKSFIRAPPPCCSSSPSCLFELCSSSSRLLSQQSQSGCSSLASIPWRWIRKRPAPPPPPPPPCSAHNTRSLACAALRSLVAVVCAVRLPRPQQHPRGLNPNPRSLQVR